MPCDPESPNAWFPEFDLWIGKALAQAVHQAVVIDSVEERFEVEV
ncbi:hypothetical protein ACVBEJ_11910 [Porticoccus sp. GXU_MW_L64]